MRHKIEYIIHTGPHRGRVVGTDHFPVTTVEEIEAIEVRAEAFAADRGEEIDIVISGERAGIRVRPS